MEQYPVFITQKEDARDDHWSEVEVNAVTSAEPWYKHWSEASITWRC
jgi:hypothetical protein